MLSSSCVSHEVDNAVTSVQARLEEMKKGVEA